MNPRRAGPLPALWTFLIALGIYVLWAGWLGWQAATLQRDILSTPQVAQAGVIVEALLVDGPAPNQTVEVVRAFRGGELLGLKPGQTVKIVILNLDQTTGWNGDGKYILALQPTEGANHYAVITIPTSPGFKEATARPIYPATETTREQVERIVGKP
jgi:hypothetical protein